MIFPLLVGLYYRDASLIPLIISMGITVSAGLILYLLRYIPREGEQLRHGNLRMTITKMKGPKIERVQIRREERS